MRAIDAIAAALSLSLAATSAMTAAPGPEPVGDGDYHYDGRPDPAAVELGRLLFYDKILSGNRDISCATCHHPRHATGDGLAVSIGAGGSGLGTARNAGATGAGIVQRVGRNAQPLFNLGAREFTTLFHDGRVEVDPAAPESLRTPIGAALPAGLDNVLAAQAIFPLVSIDEMAGRRGENEIADAVAVGRLREAWGLVIERLRRIPGYVERFANAYPDIDTPADIGIADVGNAIAAFTTVEWRADDSAFDDYLRGNPAALDATQRYGHELFYGEAGCADCHSGVFQTDHRFHAVAMPQIGPGKGHGFDGHEDFGREAVTGNPADRYRFRTPSLRNVSQTGPWGHAGAYTTLEAVVRHHLDPVAALDAHAPVYPLKPSRPDLDAMDHLVHGVAQRRAAIASRNELAARRLDDHQVQGILAFLAALTDESSLATEGGVPERVPSGLPVTD